MTDWITKNMNASINKVILSTQHLLLFSLDYVPCDFTHV